MSSTWPFDLYLGGGCLAIGALLMQTWMTHLLDEERRLAWQVIREMRQVQNLLVQALMVAQGQGDVAVDEPDEEPA